MGSLIFITRASGQVVGIFSSFAFGNCVGMGMLFAFGAEERGGPITSGRLLSAKSAFGAAI